MPAPITKEIEKRGGVGIELRAMPADKQGPGMLRALVAPFNSPSSPLLMPDGKRQFIETIAPGAFTRTLAQADIRALGDHDTGKVLGRNRAGTLRMLQTERGLEAEIDLPDTTAGRDTAVSVARGDITGMSFGFYCPPGGDRWDLSQPMALRTLLDIDIDEITVTPFPAYPDTEVALRSLNRAIAATPQSTPPAEAPANIAVSVIPAPASPAPAEASARSLPLSILRSRLALLECE